MTYHFSARFSVHKKFSYSKAGVGDQKEDLKGSKGRLFQPKKSPYTFTDSEDQDDLLKSSQGKPLPKREKNLHSWKRQDFFLKDEESIDWENEEGRYASF